MKTDTAMTLILGGNGKTGKRVADRLRRQALRFRFASRSRTIPFDWNNESTWDHALVAATSIYVTCAPDLAAPGAALQVQRLSRLAVEHGVNRLVLLAGRGDAMIQEAEQAMHGSGASHAIVESAFFGQKPCEGITDAVNKQIQFPASNVAEPFIHRDDFVDVVVAALTDDVHSDKTYNLTGPRIRTFERAASELASASGVSIEFTPITFEGYAVALEPYFSRPQVELFIELFHWLFDGHNAYTTNKVYQVLGSKVSDYSDYTQEVSHLQRAGHSVLPSGSQWLD